MRAEDGIELTLDLAPRIEPLLKARISGLAHHTPADSSFANLWLFRRAHRWRFHGGAWPCISGLSYDGRSHALPLFDIRQAPTSVLQEFLSRHGGLYPLCAHEVQEIDNGCFVLESLRDDADYVYPAEQFQHYQGRFLQKKKNLMLQFQTAHAIEIQPYSLDLLGDALSVLNGWLHDKDKAPGEADDAPCRDALTLAPQLGLYGFLARADGVADGFLLAEQLLSGVWIVRFAKGLVRFKGIAQFMFHHFSLQQGGAIDWLNFEQDLGIANFRRTKLSYRPALILQKWRLLPLSLG